MRTASDQRPIPAEALADVVWAMARLQVTAKGGRGPLGSGLPHLRAALGSARPWGVPRGRCSDGRRPFNCPPSPPPPTFSQHEPLDPTWLAAFFEASRPRMREFTPAQSARTLWALARLQVVPPAPWMDAFLAAALAGLRGLDIKSLSLTLWALATLCSLGAHRPTRGWLAAVEGHAELYVRQLGAAEAATALWALSQLTGTPPHELRLSAALRRPQLGLTQLDFELLTDIRMLRVVRSMLCGSSTGSS